MPHASLIYRTEPRTKTSKMKKLKNKNGYAQKKRCRARNHGVSPEGGRKSRVYAIDAATQRGNAASAVHAGVTATGIHATHRGGIVTATATPIQVVRCVA